MNFIKRALLSVVRKPAKSIILLLLIFILCNVIAGAVSVKSALSEAERNLRNQLVTSVEMQIDYEALDNNAESSEEYFKGVGDLTGDIIEKIGSSQYIKRFEYRSDMWLSAKGLREYFEEDVNVQGDNEECRIRLCASNHAGLENIDSDLSLKSGRDISKEDLQEGRNVILISDRFAEQNDLSLGDKVRLYEKIYDESDYDEIEGPKVLRKLEYEFEIIGIFTAPPMIQTDTSGGEVFAIENAFLNSFITTITACNKYYEEVLPAYEETIGFVLPMGTEMHARFILNRYDDLELFKAENKQHLPSGYIFTDNGSSLEEAKKPIESMSGLADLILIVTVVASVLIISLLVTLFLRDRKKEMGIYLSLGERKVKIAAQIFIEVMLIAVIAVLPSMITGNMMVKNVSSDMLADKLEAAQSENEEEYEYWAETDEKGHIESEDVMAAYSVSLNVQTSLLILAIGLGTTLVSTAVPVIYTLRLKPRRILM